MIKEKIKKKTESNPQLAESIDSEGPGDFSSVKVHKVPLRGKLTFFYQRKDGLIFAAEEQEAATGKYHRKFKFVGWSNGETYLKTIKEVGYRKNQLIPKEEAEKLLRDAFDAELNIAKKNLRIAREEGARIPIPRRAEWAFDRSVPMRDRDGISGGRYNNVNLK